MVRKQLEKSLHRLASTSVMVVDDTASVRTLLRVTLPDLGFQITAEVDNAADAIEKAHMLRPDVIILDLHMPDMSGLDALPRLKEETPHSKVVIYSNDDEPGTEREAMSQGADAFVSKLTPIDGVASTIQRILDEDV